MELPRLPRLELDQGRALHCCSPRAGGGFPNSAPLPGVHGAPVSRQRRGPQPPLLSTAPSLHGRTALPLLPADSSLTSSTSAASSLLGCFQPNSVPLLPASSSSLDPWRR
jgi:hypothetical protein